MSKKPQDDPQNDPFAGLLSKTRLSPALDVPPVDFTPPEPDTGPPSPQTRHGWVREEEIEVGLNVRMPRRLHKQAKQAALTRGLSLAAYIALLVERDTGR